LTADPFAYLFALDQFGIKLGLDNIRALVSALGHPERTFRSVHVAGTNGKGSVVAMVDASLRAAGHRTGRYTSPHLIDLTERFVVDGEPVSEAALREVVALVQSTAARLQADGILLTQPTFFEVTTAVAFELFRRAGVDVAVCEVGLGGRLDATNVLEPLASAITSIAFDHQQYLGSTLEAIAIEKAGIIKPHVPVIVGPVPEEPRVEIERIARDREARVIRAYEGVTSEPLEPASPGVNRFSLRTPTHDYGDVTVGLAGAHQVHNAVVAVRLLEAVDASGLIVPPSAVVDGLARVRWPGRLDIRRREDGREALLDAAHNPDGAASLAAFLRVICWERPPIVFGAMRDKDTSAMIAALAPVAGAFVFTRASNSRSSEPEALAETARRMAPHTAQRVAAIPHDALEAAWRISPRIVVAGSIFLLGDVLKEFGQA
jgi:dihydrofolate synthase/folylpolyglutamate synthase